MSLPERIFGSRVVLVKHRADLSNAVYEAVVESRAELAPWQPWVEKCVGVDNCVSYANWVAPQWGLRFDYQILDASSDRFLGQINLEAFRRDIPAIMVGYWLRTSATGHGYITEAAGLLMREAFEGLGVNRFELLCDSRNARSAAVAQRLGLVFEGTLRNERRDAKGELQDTMVWSMTGAEWATRLCGAGRPT